ncbi:cytochrome P450 [Scenedesmus sp. NREL 46B-D3]|nr:cytochrome P450 [Scenedesmus sp. NREL 46B-D3]
MAALLNPEEYQRVVLQSGEMVMAPSMLGGPSQLVVGNGDHAKAVMAGRGDAGLTYSNNSISPQITALFGEHALVMIKDAARHKYLRTLITPAYTPESIAGLVPRMEAVVAKHLGRWAGVQGGEVKAHEELKLFTFEFIVAVVLGHDYEDAQVMHMMRLYQALVSGILGWPYMELPFTPYGRAMAARRQLVAMFQEAVNGARVHLARGEALAGVVGSLVTAEDEEGNRLTDVEITDNLLLVLLAGFDTSSTTLTAVLANLQQHPAAADKLRGEQQAVLAKHGPGLSAAVLRDMPYAEAVVRETLRLSNVAMAIPFIQLAKNDPRWLDDEPEQFRPERMLTPEGLKPGWLMPFGHAPRYCVGATLALSEMKVFLALLLRGYEFECDADTRWSPGALGKVPRNGLPMKIARRA